MSVSGFHNRQNALDPLIYALGEAQRADRGYRQFRLGTVQNIFGTLDNAGATVLFDGEVTATSKRYRSLRGEPLGPGDRVVLAQVASTWVIIGALYDGGTGTWWWGDGTDVWNASVPTVDSGIDGMQIVVGSRPYGRHAFVSVSLAWTGDHTNRVSIYLSGSQVYPGGGSGLTGVVAGGNNQYHIHLAQLPIGIPANNAGNFQIMWNASDSTGGVTLTERRMLVEVRRTLWSGGGGQDLA
jgi:hypothetical protein